MIAQSKKRQVRLDSRSVILLRETGCERAFAMVTAGTDIDRLESAIAHDDSFADDLPLSAGSGALTFGQLFENAILKNKGAGLRAPLVKLLSEDRFFAPFFDGMDADDFHVRTFARSPAGASRKDDGNENVWAETSHLITRRMTHHTAGSIIFQGVLKIPNMERDYYVVPDVLVSPPGYPYYVPFEIKSYERMAHLTENHHIASAAVQSALYLYVLMNGYGPPHESYPEVTAPRSDLRTGIVFRLNATAIPDPMLVAAERDLVAIEKILGGIEASDRRFEERFGQSIDSIATGDLEAIEHIAATLSDACVHACRMAARCRDIAKSQQLLRAYGDGMARAYPDQTTVGQVAQAIQAARLPTTDPNLAQVLAVENEIDRLLKRVGA